MKTSKILLTAALAAAASVAMAQQAIATFTYGDGKKAEIYVGSGSNTVYVRTPISTYNTGFTKGSGSGGCDYKYADGDCYTESRMVAKVQSNMTSRGYER